MNSEYNRRKNYEKKFIVVATYKVYINRLYVENSENMMKQILLNYYK